MSDALNRLQEHLLREWEAEQAAKHADQNGGARRVRERQSPPASLPFATIGAALADAPETPQWYWEGYLGPEILTLLAGRPKVGKSTLEFALIADLLEGAPFLGRRTAGQGALLFSEERPVTLAEKVRLHLRSAPNLHLLMRHQLGAVSWPEAIEQARSYCDLHGLRVLIVDTWDKFTGLVGDEESKAGAILRAIDPLMTAAADGLAVLIVAHQRKAPGSHGEAVRGSNALTGAVDVVIELERVPEALGSNVRVLRSESRFVSTPEELVCELTEDGYVARDGDVGELAGEVEEQRLLGVLAASPGATGTQVAEQLGVAYRTAMDRLTAARKLARVRSEGAGKRGDPLRWFIAAANESTAAAIKVEPDQSELQWD